MVDSSMPVVVVFGKTGSGKSALCNTLCGLNPDGYGEGYFPVSAKPDPCTYKTTMKVTKWLGTGEPFTIVDTPGLGECKADSDTKHILAMTEELSKLDHINAFIFVVNGQNHRLDYSLKETLNIFQKMFGGDCLKNFIVAFSHWNFDKASKRRRTQSDLTEESQTRDWNQKLINELNIMLDIPMIFVDSYSDPDDPEQSKAFSQQTSTLKKTVDSFAIYKCDDINAVMSERDSMDAKNKELEENIKKMSEEVEQKNIEWDATDTWKAIGTGLLGVINPVLGSVVASQIFRKFKK